MKKGARASLEAANAALTVRDEGRSADAHVVVRRLSKGYGATHAVECVSFEVNRGEFFTLLGPSGCGKTTTLMCLAGLAAVDEGQIFVDGVDLTDAPPEKRDMGVVFQSYALFPHMTVIENVMYPLKMRKRPEAECRERARAALKLVELDAVDERRPHALSGGQQQRVALARAMAFGPSVLLMDEPLSALDRRLRQSLQFELRRLQHRTGVTVIYVTHDQEEALVLSNRIAVMRDGRFEQVGSPREVYQEPGSGFVANFLGTSNRVSGRFRRGHEARAELQVGEASLSAAHTPVTDAMADRQSASLFIRPEDLMIQPLSRGSVSRRGNRLPGTIADLVFLGDHIRVDVALSIGDRWVARIPLREVHDSLLTIGSDVELSWPVEAGRILPTD